MNNAQKTISILVFFLLAACSPKEVKTVQHEAPVPLEPVVYAPRTEPATDEKLTAFDATQAESEMKTRASSPAQRVARLRGLILNANYVENPRYRSQLKMRQALSIWNRSVLEMVSARDPEANKILNETITMILSGCDDDLTGCVNLGFFKQDPSSAKLVEQRALFLENEIAAIGAQTEKDLAVRRYYRMLMISFELRNRVTDSQFEFLYLNRGREYAESLKRLGGTGRSTLQLTQHSEIFEMVLNRFDPESLDKSSRERFRKFVDHFQPWDYSRRDAGFFGAQVATKMLELAAKDFLYESDRKTLSKSLREALLTSQKQDETDCDETTGRECKVSFSKIFEKLQKRNDRLVTNLGLTDDFPRDEYFFIIDRLFNDHLTPDDASAIWNGSKRDTNQLLLTLEKYLKVQIAWMVVKTNAYMSAIYAKKDGFTSQTLFVNAIEKSYPISNQWNLMIAKIARIGIFVNRHMKTAGVGNQSESYKRVDNMLNTLGRNIKFLSVYPNMMMMAYFMEEVDFKLRAYTMWGPIDINTEMIINLFFQGNLTPFFNFGNDPEPIMRLETLHAFYFALKTEAFQAFSRSGESIDEVKFFEKVISKYLSTTRRDLEDSYRRIWTRFSEDQGYPIFLLTCRQDKEAIAAGGQPGTRGLTLSMELENLRWFTYMAPTSSSIAQAAFGLYNDSTIESVTKVSDDVRKKSAFVGSMIAILDSHLQTVVKSGLLSDRERLLKIKQLEALISKETDAQASLLTEILKRHREVSDCMTQTMSIEFDRQYELAKSEEMFLRDVYKRMKAAREPEFAAQNPTLRKLEQVNEDYPVALPGESLPDGFYRRDQISKDEYTSWTLELLLRMRVHLNKIAPNVAVKLPTDFLSSDLWRDNKDLVLPGVLSEDEFVRLGLARLNGYITWQTNTADLNPLKGRLKLLVELYRLGDIEIFDWRQPSCGAAPIDPSCPRLKVKLQAKEILAELRATIRLASLTENGQPKKEVALLQKMGVTNRFALKDLQNFFLDDKNQPLTFVETLFEQISEDSVAVSEAKEYFNTELSVGHFLFTPDDSVSKKMRSKYRPLVISAFQATNDFAKAVRSMESEGQSSLELGYEISGAQVLTVRPQLSNDGKPIYLSRQKIDDFETRKAIFHNETRDFFKPQVGDPDFVAPGSGATRP